MTKEIFYFVYIWPEPKSSAAGIRSLDLLQTFLENGWKVTAFSPSKKNNYSDDLDKIGITTITLPANQSEQDDFLKKQKPILIVFDRFVMEEQFGWKCRELWPSAAQIIDTQDLHFLRRAREKSPNTFSTHESISELKSEDKLREISALYRVDGALVLSTWEENLLLHLQFPRENLLCLPIYAQNEAQVTPYSAREGFAFLGNFRHPPNADAVNWLIELWPSLDFPEAKLHLYGAYPPASISGLKKKINIIPHGPVDDHRAALSKHKIVLAPLRFGAGIKGKILEAWSTGTPVLGTTLAFEGMRGEGIIFQNNFAPKAKELYFDQSLWESQQKNGMQLIESHFSPAPLKEKFISFVDAVISDLQRRRERNLTGQMLRHHQHNSLKFFSRWIEEKNKERNISAP